MPRIDIPRLDLRIQGLDGTVVREALDRLPAHLAAALRQPAPREGAPYDMAAAAVDGAPLRVPAGADAPAVASALAQRIAAVVQQRRAVVPQRTATVVVEAGLQTGPAPVQQRRAAVTAAPGPAVRRGGDGG